MESSVVLQYRSYSLAVLLFCYIIFCNSRKLRQNAQSIHSRKEGIWKILVLKTG